MNVCLLMKREVILKGEELRSKHTHTLKGTARVNRRVCVYVCARVHICCHESHWASHRSPLMKLVSRCTINRRMKDISLRVFSKMMRGSSD